MFRMIQTKLLTLAVLTPLFLLSAAHAQTVRISAKASVPAGEEVRLGQIATISGTDARTAERLAETVVLATARGTQKVKAESILMAVIAQQGISRLQISGAAECEITTDSSTPSALNSSTPTPNYSANASSEKPAAMAKILTTEPAKQETATASKPTPSVITAATVSKDESAPATATTKPDYENSLSRSLIKKLTVDNDCTEDDLRISFETISPYLESAISAEQKWHFRPLNRATLGTVQFEAQLIEGSRVLRKLTVQAKVLKRTSVIVAVGTLDRGDPVTRESIKHEDAWIDRKLPTLITRDEDVIGMELLRPIAAGATFDSRDLKPVLFASKNDLINVLFQSGTLKVEMKARAMETGKYGDIIKVRNDTTGETYQAVLVAKGRATVGAPSEK